MIFGGIHSNDSAGPWSEVIISEGDFITTIRPKFSATSALQLQSQNGTHRRDPRLVLERDWRVTGEAWMVHDLLFRGRAGRVHAGAGGGLSELKTSPFK